jgi:hypothetical protein
MDDRNSAVVALERAVSRLLRPLFRILVRQGMPFGAFEKLAKKIYVEVAMNDFGIPGKKPSISRASILTGLTRKDVQSLVALPAERGSVGDEHHNRASRVLSGWVRDTDFADADADGEPRALDAEGERGFATLVRRYSGDMPARAVLDELLRVGAVRRRGDGRIELLARAYVPRLGDEQKLHILGRDVGELIGTIDHNLQHGAVDPRFQRTLAYRGVPVPVAMEFRKLSATQSQALLEKLDRWLAQQMAKAAAAEAAGGDDAEQTAQVSLGIHYYEAPGAAERERRGQA